MADFLLELLSEEIPARMQARAAADLARLFEAQLAGAGLAAERIETFATPRRLTLIARGLPAETDAVSEEIKGPRAGAPAQALEGFMRKTGLSRDRLVERDGAWFATIERPGRATASLLAEAIPAIVRAFPWPKSMRWGAASVSTESPRWVRPLQGIVALLGDQVVDFEIAGVKSGAATLGHRFHHPGVITIGGAHDYAEKLRACHVVLDPGERQGMIAGGAAHAAAAAGLLVVADSGLIEENAGLTEWPVPLLGAFDPAYLNVPREVIQLTMRTNQKYFALTDGSGALAPNFVCVANIEAGDGGAAIVAGNERVLSARLADAKFFWDQDLKVPLAEQAKKLDQIVFHEKLGTLADKVERVAKLARWLVEEGIVRPAEATPQAKVALLNHVADAAMQCKADLVTQMVGEFPELQGVIGGYLARAQGLPPQVADAISDHYKPVGQGDEVPTAPATVAVSLADKLDTIAAFFAVGEAPTGSRDPFALRRAAIAILSLLQANAIRLRVLAVFRRAVALVIEGVMSRTVAADHNYALYLAKVAEIGPDQSLPKAEFDKRMEQMRDALGEFEIVMKPETQRVFAFLTKGGVVIRETPPIILDFFADRLKVQQREAGVRHDLIDAVFALGGEDDLVRLLARVKALQAFVETPEGADLLAGYKRAANILKREGWAQSVTPAKAGAQNGAAVDSGLRRNDEQLEQGKDQPLSYTPEKEETALIAALDSAEPKAAAAIDAEDFEGAMAALASLRGPVDAFFDKVTVNDADPDKRAARLDLLMRMRDAVHRVADFSRIEG